MDQRAAAWDYKFGLGKYISSHCYAIFVRQNDKRHKFNYRLPKE